MHDSRDGFKNVLIVTNDATAFVCLEPCVTPNSRSTLCVLLRWLLTFFVDHTWGAYRESHFKNALMAVMNVTLHAPHHFTSPACPKSNGTIEAIYKDVSRATRALYSKHYIKPDEWPRVLPIARSMINDKQCPTLGDSAPLQVFLELPADIPVNLRLQDGVPEVRELSVISAPQKINADKLAGLLKDLLGHEKETRTRGGTHAVKRHNEKTNVHAEQFEMGDFVLVVRTKAD